MLLSEALRRWAQTTNELHARQLELLVELASYVESSERSATAYVTTRELSQRTGMAQSSVRALCVSAKLVEGEHYVWRGRRRLFIWAAVDAWLRASRTASPEVVPFPPARRRRA